eukprot:TRINITY_DN21100_c0_g1_i1.p1 TRINITY_DN21100_c0_g1~~TRINITY_DN21100_c0_g1_i1.p1  ORF type:complete len:995 (+),score=378.68 TRINITY_DN21100_c0_g1_i1:52-2985(+)
MDRTESLALASRTPGASRGSNVRLGAASGFARQPSLRGAAASGKMREREESFSNFGRAVQSFYTKKGSFFTGGDRHRRSSAGSSDGEGIELSPPQQQFVGKLSVLGARQQRGARMSRQGSTRDPHSGGGRRKSRAAPGSSFAGGGGSSFMLPHVPVGRTPSQVHFLESGSTAPRRSGAGPSKPLRHLRRLVMLALRVHQATWWLWEPLEERQGRALATRAREEREEEQRLQQERLLQKMLAKAVEITGDGPMPPLARAQLQYVQEGMARQLALAGAANVAEAIKILVHCEGMVHTLLVELSSLCGYPAEERAAWEPDLVRVCESLPVRFPQLRFDYSAKSRKVVVTDAEVAAAEVSGAVPDAALATAYRLASPMKQAAAAAPAPPQGRKPPGGGRIGRASNRAMQELAELRDMKRQERKAATRGMTTQTDAKTLEFHDLDDYKALRAQTITLLERVTALEAENKQLAEQLAEAQESLEAKQGAVQDIRVGVYRELCSLQMRSGLKSGVTPPTSPRVPLPTQAKQAYRQRETHDLSFYIDGALMGLEEAADDPEGLRTAHPVNQLIAVREDLAKVKRDYAADRAQWRRETMRLEKRFRTVLAERSAKEAPGATKHNLSSDHYYNMQDAVDLVKCDYNVFVGGVQDDLRAYQTHLAGVQPALLAIMRRVESLLARDARCSLLESMFSGFMQLVRPLLQTCRFGASGSELVFKDVYGAGDALRKHMRAHALPPDVEDAPEWGGGVVAEEVSALEGVLTDVLGVKMRMAEHVESVPPLPGTPSALSRRSGSLARGNSGRGFHRVNSELSSPASVGEGTPRDGESLQSSRRSDGGTASLPASPRIGRRGGSVSALRVKTPKRRVGRQLRALGEQLLESDLVKPDDKKDIYTLLQEDQRLVARLCRFQFKLIGKRVYMTSLLSTRAKYDSKLLKQKLDKIAALESDIEYFIGSLVLLRDERSAIDITPYEVAYMMAEPPQHAA